MKIFLSILLISIFIAKWLFFKLGIGVRILTWLPEFGAAILAVIVLIGFATNRNAISPERYLFILFFYGLVIIGGFLLNGVSAGPIFAGLRYYTYFLPYFFLPFAFNFKEKDMRYYLLLIFSLALLQVPVVILQKFIIHTDSMSGDPMGGTLGANASGALTVFLISTIGFLVAFYLKGRIALWKFVIITIFIFIPTTLNETKVTFLLVPVAFFVPALFAKLDKRKFARMFSLLVLMGGLLFILKTIYNYFALQRWGYDILTFFLERGGTYASARYEPLLKTIKMALDNITFFAFGVGAGNASTSFYASMSGAYAAEFAKQGMVSLSAIITIWEIGFLGFFVLIGWFIMVFFDSRSLAKRDPTLWGVFGLGMIVVTLLEIMVMCYANPLRSNMMILFMLFSGMIAARNQRIKKISSRPS